VSNNDNCINHLSPSLQSMSFSQFSSFVKGHISLFALSLASPPTPATPIRPTALARRAGGRRATLSRALGGWLALMGEPGRRWEERWRATLSPEMSTVQLNNGGHSRPVIKTHLWYTSFPPSNPSVTVGKHLEFLDRCQTTISRARVWGKGKKAS